MKKTIKILLAVVLSFAMVFAFAGCGDQSVSLDKSNIAFTKTGETAVLQPTVVGGNSGEIVWTSSKPEVATVVNGVVTALANGETDITAKIGESAAVSKVAVAIEFSLRITSAKAVNIKTTAADADKTTVITHELNLATVYQSNKVVYSSSNTGIAQVDGTGKVTAVANGVATITVTSAEIGPIEGMPGAPVGLGKVSDTVSIVVNNQWTNELVGNWEGITEWEGVGTSKDNGSAAKMGKINCISTLDINEDGTYMYMSANMKRSKYKLDDYSNMHPYNNIAQKGENGFVEIPKFSMANFNTKGIIYMFDGVVGFTSSTLTGKAVVGDGYIFADKINAKSFVNASVGQSTTPDCDAMASILTKKVAAAV